MDEIGKAIENFENHKGSLDEIAHLLCREIGMALKGMRHSSFRPPRTGHCWKFNLIYKRYTPDELPDFVAYNETEEDFSDALHKLWEHMIEKIKDRDPKTLQALKGDEESRIKWIRSTLGLVLANKVFKKEIKGKVPDEIPLETAISGKDGETCDIHLEDIKAAADYKESLIERNSSLLLQKAAFFWRPGELLNDFEIKADRPIYIAFFYSWLRRCSFATFEMIAAEAEVRSAAAPSRDWIPVFELSCYFPDAITDIIFPVFLSREARDQIGLFNRSWRCFSRKTCGETYRKEILPRKEVLWELYELLREMEQCSDYYEMSFDLDASEILPQAARNRFDAEYRMNDDLDLPSNRPFLLLYIRSICFFEDKRKNGSADPIK